MTTRSGVQLAATPASAIAHAKRPAHLTGFIRPPLLPNVRENDIASIRG
ncbi:conserved hypothetical protein [Burkholderia mallei PRL-20]|nr:conserved hypothetical protein [Burkholderia mallei SAVP1]EDK57042.1 hypothetical protein BMAJHU_J0019 [Burkholderia mallei JHU]EDK86731.1 conserved hypothetical protein [Burkholderia mallei 2002721280]EDO95416.1 conserved hypothetical protein [Burkholderia pseudomallei Pasteur 52237]EDU06841.1 conserved hypothetical protein [Burkholderia pseudomallei 1655]EEC33735.1 conserved hypothetical protein [Burkholderia pseudomallei 576]EEP86556.1 conserved hypothetical protein [Burkholderia mallei